MQIENHSNICNQMPSKFRPLQQIELKVFYEHYAVSIVLVENKEVDCYYVRSYLHSAINLPFYNFEFESSHAYTSTFCDHCS